MGLRTAELDAVGSPLKTSLLLLRGERGHCSAEGCEAPGPQLSAEAFVGSVGALIALFSVQIRTEPFRAQQQLPCCKPFSLATVRGL